MMSGLQTLSSKLPSAPPKLIATSLPSTCAASITTASDCVGFTLPGMMELPGSFSGMRNSPSPARGPEASQRMSLAILNRLTASVLSAPCAWTSASLARQRLELVGRGDERESGRRRKLGRYPGAELGMGVESGAHRGAAYRQFAQTCGSAASMCAIP